MSGRLLVVGFAVAPMLLLGGCEGMTAEDIGVAVGVGGGILGAIIGVLVVVVSVVGTLLITIVSIALPILLVVFVMKKMKGQNQDLLTKGEKATARVLKLEETGMLINNQPLVNIQLSVQRASGPPYEASCQKVLSILAIPRVQPGEDVAVRVDPKNPARVALDLGAEVEVKEYCEYCGATYDPGPIKCPHCGAAAS